MEPNAPKLPKDNQGIAIQLSPRRIALARTVTSSISASTTITFNQNTTFLRIYSADKDTYLKWGATAVTSSNFDEVIPANQICDFLIPIDVSTGLPFTTCKVIERAATATLIVIEK